MVSEVEPSKASSAHLSTAPYVIEVISLRLHDTALVREVLQKIDAGVGKSHNPMNNKGLTSLVCYLPDGGN